MNKLLTLLLLIAAFTTDLYSQGCIPIVPQPGSSCQDAPFLCCGEVNGFSGTLPTGVNVNGPNPLCPGTTNVANNIEWVSFAAGTTSVTLNLNITNCTAGNGVQVGVYTDCGFSQSVYCNGGQNMGNLTIVLSPLIIGDVYHLFIDGWAGDVCDYAFTVTDGNTFAPEPQSPSIVTGLTSLCPGAPDQTYTAPLGFNSSFNYWTVTPGDVSFNDNGSSMTVTDWGSAVGGTATICAEGLNDCYQDPTGVNQACITVTINENQMDVAFGTYCQEDGGYIFPENGQSYPAGVYSVPIDNPSAGLGCEIIYDLTVEEFIPIDLDSFLFLCPGEPYIVNGTPFYPPINGLPVPFGVDDNFCNRFLNLSLAVIDTSNYIQASPTTVLNCDVPNILLTAVVPNFDPQITYIYEWDTDDGFFVSQSGQIAIINEPGTYTVQITMEAVDDRGLKVCVAALSQIVITADVSGPSLSSTAQTPSSCGTTLNGTASVFPTGGAVPYSYLWDSAAGDQTTPTATGLAPGIYSITVSDANMCDNITTVEVFGTPIVEIDDVPIVQNINCINDLTGEITVAAIGGTGTIVYQWDSNAGAQTGPTVSGLGAGSYWVTATDDLGCQDSLLVTIIEPTSAVAGTVDGFTASACGQATGTIDITPSGGTPPYTYMWSNSTMNQDLSAAGAGSYQVTIFDNLGCETVLTESIPNADGPSISSIDITNVDCFGNSTGELNLVISGGAVPYVIDWDNAPDVINPTGLGIGNYNVTVTDNNMCTVLGSATITQPDLLTASVNPTQSNCSQSTGSLQLTVTGGSAIATYDWDSAPDIEDPSGLPAGTYNVIVTDINGCVANASAIITEPDAPVGTSTFTNVSCNGADDGSVSINITAGGGGYMYDWGSPSLNNNASNGSLAPGVYDIIVTDANNCTAVFQEEIEQPTLITATITPTSTLCFGQANGSAIAIPSGGVGTNYLYQWCSAEDTQTATSLLSGACAVTITDETGCQQIFNTTIPEADVFESQLVSITPLQCNDDESGAISISTNGGTGTFEYDWTGGTIPNNVEDPTGLDAGFYSVLITDENDCTSQLTNLEVTEPPALNLSGTTDEATCNLPNGSINAVVMGGTGNIDYSWTPTLPNSPDHNQNLAAGTYSVIITDGNGCQETETFVVAEPDALEVIGTDGSTVDCFGDTDGTASIEIDGGSGLGTYSYDWGPGFPDAENIDGLVAGIYTVIVTDADGCTIEGDAEVTQPEILTLDLVNAIDPSCQVEDGAISISITGGTVSSDYSFDWNSGDYSDQNISGLPEGTYSVVITDDNDCIITGSYDIEAPETFIPSENNVDVSCNSFADGEITVSNTNGSGDFSYDWSVPSIGDTPNATGLNPGFYDVVITDNITGCEEEILQIEITEPSSIDVSVSNVIDASCLNNDGSIDVNISGGAGGFQFNWNGPGISNETTQGLTNLMSGDFVLDILDANDCPAQLMVNVAIPTPPTIDAVPTDVLCNAGSTGTIQLTTTGANGNVVYSWSDPTIGDTDLATGLAQGTYDVIVTDDENCTAELLSIMIDQPAPLLLSTESFQTDCDVDNGSINLTASGGVGNYSYDWQDIVDVEDPSGLGIGTYFVTVLDENLCPAQTSAEITQPTPATASALSGSVSCFNGNNGSINLDVNGDNPPYNFTWTGTTQNVQDPIGLTAGTYSVVVSDEDGCTTAVNDIIVDQPEELQITFTTDLATCSLANGTIDVEVSGGTGNVNYAWTPTLPNQPDHLGTLLAGTYNLEITDDNGCDAIETIVVDEPVQLEVLNESPSDVLCFGGNDGTATVEISGGSGLGTYSYDWGGTYPDAAMITDLTAGTYPVVITDTDGCMISTQVVVGEPAPLAITVDQVNTTECQTPTGSIEISVAGGTVSGDYNYDWNSGDFNTQDLTGLGVGTYVLAVTDDNGCPAEETVQIVQPDAAIVTSLATATTCFDGINGSINLDVIGTNPPYYFDWTGTTQTIEDPVGLSAGTYSVIVSDDDGCETLVDNIEVGQPEQLEITFTTADASCNLPNGTIDVQVTGGTGNIDYTWTPTLPNQATHTGSVSSGTYDLLITDANGCDANQSIVVDEPNALAVLNEIGSTLLCNGGTDGTASVEITGGSGAGTYSYDWGTAYPDAASITSLPAGTYPVIITDQNDCNISAQVVVDEPTPVQIELDNFDDPSCQTPDGQIDISVTGGTVTGDYTYNWNNGTYATQDISSLGSGSYNVTVTDDNGCPAEETFSIQAPGSFTPAQVETDITCNSFNDGTISISTIDGSGNFDFAWSDPTVGNVQVATDLTPGFYDVTITDIQTGCVNTLFAIEIEEPLAINISGTTVDPTCLNNNGEISTQVDGGTGTLTYIWSGPGITNEDSPMLSNLQEGNYQLNISDSNGCPQIESFNINMPDNPTVVATPIDALCNGSATGLIQTNSTSPNGTLSYVWSDPAFGDVDMIDSLAAGSYTVVVTDPLDCTAEALNIIVGEPMAIDVQFQTTDSNCDVDNGTIDLTPTGGVGGFTFDWENLPDIQNQINVGPDNYSVTVYDSNLCPFELTVPVSQPQAAQVTFTSTNVACFNQATGSIDLTVVGTNGPYNFDWTGTTQNIEDPIGLPAGTYSVVVSDNDGCDTPIAGIEITQGTEIIVNPSITPALCGNNDGAINLDVSGGSGTYDYIWADPNIGNTSNPTLLVNGNYAVTVVDALGCEYEDAFAVNDPSGVQFQQDQQDVLCNGENTGTATVDIQSGVNPITVEWTSSALPNIPDGLVASDLPAGLYTALVTDGNGCPTNINFDIQEPAALSALTQTSQSVSCFGFNDGGAVAQVVGGTEPYNYLWSNNEDTDEILGIGAGIEYTVTVTDDNGCEFIPTAILLTQPDELILSESVTELICNGGEDAAIALQVSGGNLGAFDFDWNVNQFDGAQNIDGLPAGTYLVTVTDIENCSDELSIVIDDPEGMDVMVEEVSSYDGFNVTCFGSEDGFISVNATGGTGGISYLWDDANATTGSTVTDIGEGTYTVVITDANDCSTIYQETLNQPEEIQLDFQTEDVSCIGDANGLVIVTNTFGGAAPYLYGIDQGPLGGNGIISGLQPGEYNLSAEDANGCLVEQTFEIEEPDSLLVDLSAAQEVISYGDSTYLSTQITMGGAPIASMTWDNETILCPDGGCVGLTVSPLVTTTYRVTVIDENGCEHEDLVQVRVKKDRNVYIPNAFNPNSSSGNDIFQIFTGKGVTMIEDFIVVDRWGEIMYRIPEAFEPNTGAQNWGWDGTISGTPMNPGVYVYYAKIKFIDGEVVDYAGDITLLK